MLFGSGQVNLFSFIVSSLGLIGVGLEELELYEIKQIDIVSIIKIGK